MERHLDSQSDNARDSDPATSEDLDPRGASPRIVLLATDGSGNTNAAVEKAVSIARGTGADLHVVHVWHDVPTAHFHNLVRTELKRRGQEVLDEQTERIEETGVRVTDTHLRTGHTADEIVDLAERVGADLIVAGSRSLGPVGRVLVGSVSARVVRHAPCPVLVVSNRDYLRTPVGEQMAMERSL